MEHAIERQKETMPSTPAKCLLVVARERRADLVIKHRAEMASLRHREMLDMRRLLDLAPKELQLFIFGTRALEDLFESGECTIDDIDSGTYKEFGFEDAADARAKLLSLSEAWQKEIRVHVAPKGGRGALLVKMSAAS